MEFRFFICKLILVCSLCLVWTVIGAAGDDANKQFCAAEASGSPTSCAAAASTSVAAVLLPSHGSTQQEAKSIRSLAQSLQFASHIVVITPDRMVYDKHDLVEDEEAEERGSSVPDVLQHNILWDANSAAALNEAAKTAEAAGAAWMLVATAGDQVAVFDSDKLQQQLESSRQPVLFCHRDRTTPEAQACLFKLPLQGEFQGPAEPVFFPGTGHSTSGGNDISSSSSSSSVSAAGISLLPTDCSYECLKARVSLLRRLTSQSPPHKAFWLLQLAAAFESLSKRDLALQHYQQCYDTSSSRQLAAYAMYKVGELHLREDNFAGALAAAAKGLARHPSPELLWLASLAAYRSNDFHGAIRWAAMAGSLGCMKGSCQLGQRSAFAEFDSWFEKPYDVLRFAYMQDGDEALRAEAEATWEAASAKREGLLGVEGSSGYMVGGLQWLALLRDEEDVLAQPSVLNKPRIAASITTAHRPAFFKRAWYSFRSRCLDCDTLVDKWYAVDDGSSAADLAIMQSAAPPCTVTWLSKSKEQAGHVGSLNRVLEEVNSQGFEYLVHLEDDWHFFVEEEFVFKALQIMEHDKNIIQVLFNPDYADMDAEWEVEHVQGGDLRMTPDGVEYLLHVYAGPVGSPEHDAYMAKLPPGKLSNCHWPGFSLRPGVWRLSALQNIGMFEEGVQFENAYALKAAAKGYRVAFFKSAACVHLAPTATWLQEKKKEIDEVYERHGLKLQHSQGHQRSAYDSNLSER